MSQHLSLFDAAPDEAFLFAAPPPPPATPPAEQVTDPVCEMRFSRGGALGGRVRHGEHSYFFCSRVCRERFEASPERYVPALPVAPAPWLLTRQAPGLLMRLLLGGPLTMAVL